MRNMSRGTGAWRNRSRSARPVTCSTTTSASAHRSEPGRRCKPLGASADPEYSQPGGAPPRFLLRFPPDQEITSWRYLMARHLFAILDDLTANLAELKAALAPLVLIGGAVVAETRKPASAPRRAKGAAWGGEARSAPSVARQC